MKTTTVIHRRTKAGGEKAVPRNSFRALVGERLRITAAELGFPSAIRLAEHLGLERPAVDAWYNGKALPPVQAMIPFCNRWGLTLDWIYNGDPSALPLSRSVQLTAAMEGDKPP